MSTQTYTTIWCLLLKAKHPQHCTCLWHQGRGKILGYATSTYKSADTHVIMRYVTALQARSCEYRGLHIHSTRSSPAENESSTPAFTTPAFTTACWGYPTWSLVETLVTQCFAMQPMNVCTHLIDDLQTHVLGSSLNHANHGVDLGGVGVGQLGLGNLCYLGLGHLAHNVLVGLAGTPLNACSLLEEHRCGGGLQDEGEATVLVHSDLHGDNLASHLRSLSVVLLAESHNVHTLGTQCRTNRRRGVGLSCRQLQLDLAGDLCSHGSHTPCCCPSRC
mmetsp:Transcript_29382/g.65069  ORF Transcript_29382/g.65069 Transcript_29382/m.65069 type:complete len:276 (-) Transcript_29382:224-1051(-)